MKPILITALISGFIGFIAGNAFWYLASPLWIDRIVAESIAEGGTILATGQFSGADASHKGAGQVAVIDQNGQTIVRFTEFEVTNGPDLYVWLVKAGNIQKSADVKASEWIELGVLKGNIGDQNYSLPAGTDISEYQTVIVWCRQFGVLFAAAALT